VRYDIYIYVIRRLKVNMSQITVLIILKNNWYHFNTTYIVTAVVLCNRYTLPSMDGYWFSLQIIFFRLRVPLCEGNDNCKVPS